MKPNSRQSAVTGMAVRILTFLFMAAFLTSSGIFTYTLCEHKAQEAMYKKLQERFPETVPKTQAVIPEPEHSSLPEPSPEELNKTAWEQEYQSRVPVYRELAKEHGDFSGWLVVEGTTIDYPVCHTPDDPEYYLRRNLAGQKSSYGTLFMDAICRPSNPEMSVIIYGHHMKDGSMFAPLEKYREEDYLEDHPFVHLDTLTGPGTYKAAAVMLIPDGGASLPWAALLFPANVADFGNAVSTLSPYTVAGSLRGLDPEDTLLALSTCDYSADNARLMLVCRKLQ